MEGSDTSLEHDVFLSYARHDAARIRPLVEALESGGLDVWWDTRIDAGSEFDRVIERHLAASRCVVVLWSEASVESEWVRNEAAEGLARGILVPVLLDDVQPPLAFRRRQALVLDGSEDARTQILAAVRSVVEGSERTPGATHAGNPRTAPARARRSMTTGASLLITAVLAALLGWALRPQPATDPLGITIALPGYESRRQAPRGFRPNGSFALSRDGAYLAWIGHDSASPDDVVLYVKGRELPTPRRIEGSRGAQTPVFSPDGTHVAFFAEGQLRRARVAGGPATTIARVSEVVLGADWCQDDTIVFSNGYRSPIRRVPASGGATEDVTVLAASDRSHRYPRCGDGGPFLFTRFSKGGFGSLVAFLEGEERLVELIDDAAAGRPARNGHLVFHRRRSIWSVPFDAESLSTSGEAAVIIEGAGNEFSLSDRGDLLAELDMPRGDARLRLVRGDTSFSRPDTNALSPSVSPSGEQIAVQRLLGSDWEIWIHEAASGLPARQLTFDGGFFPIWSPDGRRLLFWRPGKGLLSIPADGSTPPEVVVEFEDVAFPLQWREEGLLYAALQPLTASDLLFRTDTGETLTLDDSASATPSAAISPDGRFIAYANDETGREEIYVRRFPDGQTRWRVSDSGGEFPRWTADGRKLYFQAHDRILKVPVDTGGEVFVAGEPELIARLPRPGGFPSRLYDVMPDESSLVLAEHERPDAPALVLLTGLNERLAN